jgi:tetratricopeptide (TPR) repeat protein
MVIKARFMAPLLLAIASASAFATTPDLDQELAALARESDIAKFETADGDPRFKAFEALQQHAAKVTKQYPGRAEPVIWEAWAIIEQSVVLKNFHTLGLLKQSRNKLEAALAINPNNSDANSTLGSLYFNVPIWPLSFGDKKKGRALHQKALAVDPMSSWKNLDYAKCLFKDDDYLGAVKYATITAHTPMRPGSKRDASTTAEAEALIVKAKEKLR